MMHGISVLFLTTVKESTITSTILGETTFGCLSDVSVKKTFYLEDPQGEQDDPGCLWKEGGHALEV